MYGNRSLDIAKSRYLIHLHSTEAVNKEEDTKTGAKTFVFPTQPVFNIDPKFQTSVVRIRDFAVIADTSTHSEYDEPEPLTTSIRDDDHDGGPARYVASSDITLGDKVSEGEFKWSATNSPFQINLELHPDIEHDDSEHPAVGTIPYWNGDRWNYGGTWQGLPHDLNGSVVHPHLPHTILFFKNDTMYSYDLDTQTQTGTADMSELFPEIHDHHSINGVFRASNANGTNAQGEPLYKYIVFNTDSGAIYEYEWDVANEKFVFDNIKQDTSGADEIANALGVSWDAQIWFDSSEANGNRVWYKAIDGEAGSANDDYVAYGAGTGIFEGLPDLPVDSIFHNLLSGNFTSIATIGGTMYELDIKNKVVLSSYAYGTASAHMDTGNWIDGDQYTLKMNPAGNLSVWTYGNSTPTITPNAEWTITAYGNTILYGTIEYSASHDITRLLLHRDGNNLPVYRPFNATNFTPANPQEAFEHDLNTEVVAYDFGGKLADLQAGATLTPELLKRKSEGGVYTANHTPAPRVALATPANLYGIYLNSASLPNSQEVSGQTKLLEILPLTELDATANSVFSYEATGDVSTRGTLVGDTCVNRPLKITIAPLPNIATTRGDDDWYMTLEVQLLCNETERVDTIN